MPLPDDLETIFQPAVRSTAAAGGRMQFDLDLLGSMNGLLPLFQVESLLPHGYCYLWRPGLLWLHLISDSIITLAYYCLPVGLVYFVRRRRDMPFNWIFWMFAIFIAGCGTTHLMEIWTLWHPSYWVSGGTKAVTAVASLGTAVAFVALLPKAVALPSSKQLADANHELETFSYSVSHDLRAPLRAMQGFAQALLEDYGGRLDSTGQHYAGRIVSAAERMDLLIQDLLAYSRLGRLALDLAPVELDAVVRDALALQDAELKERRARVNVDTPLPRVRAHAATLRQVVANLVSNAAKFVATGTEPRVRVRAEEHDDRVRLWVEDNGIGVAPEHHERVFRVFERLHGIESYPGTGIGLAIVRKGMERMGGRSGVESEPGRGSRFWIEFPHEGLRSR